MTGYTPDELTAARLVGDHWLRNAMPAVLPGRHEWAAIVAAAIKQGLGPLLFAAVQAWRHTTDIPADSINRLRLSYMRTLRDNSLRFAALEQILKAFNAAGNKAILLKGCALAPTLYGDYGLRVISDIDVLVDATELPAARSILENIGFSTQQAMQDEHYVLANMGEMTYTRSSPHKAVVDLHWRLIHVPGFAQQVDTAWFQNHVRPVVLANQPTFVLDPGAQMLHCAVHYHLHHIGGSLKWTFDVALLLAKHGAEIQWPQLHEFCRRTDTITPVTIMLEHVSQIWATDVPRGATQAGFEQTTTSFNWRMKLQLLHSPLRHFYLSTKTGRLADSLRYTRSVLFPSRAYLQKRYGAKPDESIIPYYLQRLGNGVREVLHYVVRHR